MLKLGNKLKFESIINWELHNKTQSKKQIHFTLKRKEIKFCSNQKKIMDEMKNLNYCKIGNQIWMSENLYVNKFRNGDEIYQAKNEREWVDAGKNGEPAWCYYDFDSANELKFGKLYNWYAVNDARGLAPDGWRVPSLEEALSLVKYWGISIDEFGDYVLSDMNHREVFTPHTNGSGFGAVKSGRVNSHAVFEGIELRSAWWTSDENVYQDEDDYINDGLVFHFDTDSEPLLEDWETAFSWEKAYGYPVRCIKISN